MLDICTESTLVPTAPSPLPPARNALVFAPHADDEVLGCGATLHRLTKAGASIHVAILTDGALGGPAGSDDLAMVRQQEAIAAAKVLGYGPPEFWGLPDRSIRVQEPLIEKMMQTINDSQPELIFTPALSENHPDHQATSLATIEALRRLVRSGYKTAQLLLYEVSSPLSPNMLIDISAEESIKRHAIQCFASQLAHQPYDEQIAGLNRFRSYSTGNQIRAAEAFYCIDTGHLESAGLFQSALSKRIRNRAAIDSSELPLVSVLIETQAEGPSASSMESLASQSYPNLEFLLIGPGPMPAAISGAIQPLGLKTAASLEQAARILKGRLALVLRQGVVVAPNTVERMVDQYRIHGIEPWGAEYGIESANGRVQMVLSDQLLHREKIKFHVMSNTLASPPSMIGRILKRWTS